MSEQESPDYYRGFHDGFHAANKERNKTMNPPDIGRMPVGPGLVEPQIKCQKCGMMWKGVMGYVCPRMDCVIQPKIIAASNQEKL